jgi:hypothetical protein
MKEYKKQKKLFNQTTTTINRNIHDLPNYEPMKPYVIFYMYRTQSQFLLGDSIRKEKRLKRFTIVPKTKS